MATVFHGRVVEIRETSGQLNVVVSSGTTFHSYTVDPAAPAAVLGALVRVSGNGTVDVIGRPTAPWDPAGDARRWSQVRAKNLWARQTIIKTVRDDLVEHGFLEFETPLLVPGGCPDSHLASVETTDGKYLVTSTEYQLKRLVAGGFDRVFSLTKNFRAGDIGRFHSAEFTMLEWARAWETLAVIEDDAERFVRRALRAVRPGVERLVVNGHDVLLDGARWERLPLRAALDRHLGVRVDDAFSLASMTAGSDAAGLALPKAFRADEHLTISFLLGELQPYLGHPLPTFLEEWPAFMTSSALVQEDNAAVAHRSELYIAGIEISDGFPFLRDGRIQRETFARENNRRAASGLPRIRVDEKYLAALDQGLPPGAGMALGVDRLVMSLLGASNLTDVQPFAHDEL